MTTSLLSLPAELRLIIYRFTFDAIPFPTKGAKPEDIEPTALFAICHSICAEVTEEWDLWTRRCFHESARRMRAAINACPMVRGQRVEQVSLCDLDEWIAAMKERDAREAEAFNAMILCVDLCSRSRVRQVGMWLAAARAWQDWVSSRELCGAFMVKGR